MGEVDEGRCINDGDPQQSVLVKREKHDETEAECRQRTHGLLVAFVQLLLFEEFHDLSFNRAGIVPGRERENPRKPRQKRIAGKIRAHNRNDELPALQRVAWFILNHLIRSRRYDREDAVSAIDGLLHSRGPRCSYIGSMLGHVHLDTMRRGECL